MIRAALQELAEFGAEGQEIGFLKTTVLPAYRNNVIDSRECDPLVCGRCRFEINNEHTPAPPCEVAPGTMQLL